MASALSSPFVLVAMLPVIFALALLVECAALRWEARHRGCGARAWQRSPWYVRLYYGIRR